MRMSRYIVRMKREAQAREMNSIRLLLGILKYDSFNRAKIKTLDEIHKYFIKRGRKVERGTLRNWIFKIMKKTYKFGRVRVVTRGLHSFFYIDREKPLYVDKTH